MKAEAWRMMLLKEDLEEVDFRNPLNNDINENREEIKNSSLFFLLHKSYTKQRKLIKL